MSNLVTSINKTTPTDNVVSEKAVVAYVADQIVTFGVGVPTTAPPRIGLFYMNTTTKKLYISMGIAVKADWHEVRVI